MEEDLGPQLRELGLSQGVRTYVDDIRLQVRGPMVQAAALARHLYDAIAEGLRADGAKLQANTCAAMATSQRMRKELRTALDGTGVPTPLHARDLGGG